MLSMDPKVLLETVKKLRAQLRKAELEYDQAVGNEAGDAAQAPGVSTGMDEEAAKTQDSEGALNEESPAGMQDGESEGGEGEDGSEVSIEMEAKGAGSPEDALAMLHKRMQEEMGMTPKSRAARPKAGRMMG